MPQSIHLIHPEPPLNAKNHVLKARPVLLRPKTEIGTHAITSNVTTAREANKHLAFKNKHSRQVSGDVRSSSLLKEAINALEKDLR